MSINEEHHPDITSLHEYLDDAIDPVGRNEVESHIADCSQCSEKLQELRELFYSLESLPDLPLERDLAHAVVTAIRPRLRFSRDYIFSIAAQSLVFGLLLIIVWPSISIEISELVVSITNIHLPAGAIENLINVLRQWSTVLDNTTEIVSRGLVALGKPPTFSWPLLDGWLIIGATVIIWLAGNGLLLRGSRSDQKSKS